MRDSVRIVLPIPPSLNSSYTNVPGRGRVPTAALRQWKCDAGWRLNIQRPRKISGPYRFAIYLPARMAGDVDNRIKAALDLLVARGVTDDDKHAQSTIAERSEAVDRGQCLIIVEAA